MDYMDFNEEKKRKGYSRVSFILAIIPASIFVAVFLICLLVTVSDPSGNAGSAIWWLLIAVAMILIPVVIVTGIISIIFGIKGLKGLKGVKGKRAAFAWAGIITLCIEAVAVLLFFVLVR